MPQYSPKKLIRNISNPLLKRYFDQRELLSDLDWKGLEDHDTKPVMEVLDELSASERESVETDFNRINELATDSGSRLIFEEASFWNRPWAGKLEEMANDYERAMLAMIEDRRLIDIVSSCNEMDRFAESRWKSWIVGKRLQVTDEREKLKKGLRALFKEQGRGQRCHIETLDRRDPERFCCFAYPEDYPKTDLGYDENNQFKRHTRRTATEIIFVYRPEDGILEMLGKGNKKEKEAIAEVFCKTMLGLTALPPPNQRPPYDLAVLKRKNFSFKTDPADNIESTEIRLMRFDLPGPGYRRMTLSARPTDGQANLHDLIEEAVNTTNFPLSDLLVSQAIFAMRFRGKNGRRGNTLRFQVTYPDHCNLKDTGKDAIAKKYLKQWGIARG